MNYLEKSCEELDATVFSSDMMFDPERYAMFKRYLGRWNRAVEEHNKAEMTDATPPAPPVQEPVQEQLGSVCADGGTCHHQCTERCFRRECCAPFSDYVGPWSLNGAQPAPEQYTALEQALTRLQKRYGELEAKVAAQPAPPVLEPVGKVIASVPHLRSISVELLPEVPVPPEDSLIYTTQPAQPAPVPLTDEQITQKNRAHPLRTWKDDNNAWWHCRSLWGVGGTGLSEAEAVKNWATLNPNEVKRLGLGGITEKGGAS